MTPSSPPAARGRPPQPAVSVEPGAIWGHVYNEVTTKGGRYVQGGGCLTVGVAGLILGGGFGSFSKAFGMAGANLLEAEIVTADGDVKIANACSSPDLFWALKGGGGGFGVVTRLTLRTHALPDTLGIVMAGVKSSSDDAHRRLAAKVLEFYRDALFNPHWGEQIVFWPESRPEDFDALPGPRSRTGASGMASVLRLGRRRASGLCRGPGAEVLAGPARHFWDPAMLRHLPGVVIPDDRPGAPPDNIFWASNLGETGVVWRAYQSAWLPSALLEDDKRQSLADALVLAARHGVELHFNKGLAGGSAEAIAMAKDTATNPAVTEAFALVIGGAFEQPAYPAVPGHEPDIAAAKRDAAAVTAAMDEIRKLTPRVGVLRLGDRLFPVRLAGRLLGRKLSAAARDQAEVRPDGLFFLHHGVGSEDWSEDGFSPAN